MPLTAAQGAISLAETYLAATLAACAQWQTLTGAADADEAAERIYYDALPPPPNNQDAYTRQQLEELRPYCVIFSDEETGLTFDHDAHGVGFGYRDAGILKGFLESAVDPQIAHDPQEIFRRFKNDVGLLVADMLALAGLAGYLAISTLTLRGPLRSHEDQLPGEGDYVQYHFTINWGRR
jgi:hypothetical protein